VPKAWESHTALPNKEFMKVRLLLSTWRSGSHFLKSFIEAHFPAVVCSGEILRCPDALVLKYPVLGDHPETPYEWMVQTPLLAAA